MDAMTRIVSLVLMLMAIMNEPMNAEPMVQSPGDQARTFISTMDGSTQPYRLYVPQAWSEGNPLPLAVVLHGKFVDQNAWFDYTPIKEFAEKYGYIAAAPYARGDYFYQGPGEQDVLDIIAEVKRIYSVDPERVYLMGHSMGGWGTWWIGLRHPDVFATICPMAGFAPLELLPNALHLDPLIIHDATDPIVSVEHSRGAAARLQGLGISYSYREEQGYGHDSRMIGDNLDRVFEWMNAHRLNSKPDRVALSTRTPLAGRAYWLRILETVEVPRLGTLEADIRPGGSIAVRESNIARFALNLEQLPCGKDRRFSLLLKRVTYPITARSGWVVLMRAAEGDRWMLECRDEAPCAWESPVLGTVACEIVRASHPEYLLQQAGRWIVEETGADAVLFTEDMFIERLAPGPLTLDTLLSLYLYSERRLGRFVCTTGELKALLETPAPAGKEWWGNLRAAGKSLEEDPARSCNVVAPLHVAKTFVEFPEILPDPIPIYLYQAAKRQAPVTLGAVSEPPGE